MVQEIHVDVDEYLANREAIEAWVADHGLVGKNIPLPSTIRIDAGQVTVDEYVRKDDGKIVFEGDEVRKTTRTVPLVRAWPLP